MISFFLEHREARRVLLAAHRVAMEDAWAEYERYRGQPTVLKAGSGPDYSFVSAASPERLAWDEYFDSMGAQGFNAWATKDRFDREFQPK